VLIVRMNLLAPVGTAEVQKTHKNGEKGHPALVQCRYGNSGLSQVWLSVQGVPLYAGSNFYRNELSDG